MKLSKEAMKEFVRFKQTGDDAYYSVFYRHAYQQMLEHFESISKVKDVELGHSIISEILTDTLYNDPDALPIQYPESWLCKCMRYNYLKETRRVSIRRRHEVTNVGEMIDDEAADNRGPLSEHSVDHLENAIQKMTHSNREVIEHFLEHGCKKVPAGSALEMSRRRFEFELTSACEELRDLLTGEE